MNPQKTLFVSMLILSFFLIQSASALIVYLRPPKMIIYTNVTPVVATEIERSLEIRNENNVTMSVEFRPGGDIQDITHLDQQNITLEPKETRDVNFTVTLTEPGSYYGKIIVTYSTETSPGIALQAEIIIHAEGPETTTTIESYPPTGRVILGLSWLQLGLIFIVVIILLSFGVVRLRRK